jgi:hypothetical protein
MASEERLQSDIVRKFSELYPEKSGQLFHASNERNHKLQAFKARAIGIIPGVADLIYFSKYLDVATEIKAPGSRHLIATVRGQLRWGRVWESQGNTWRLCTTVDEAISCYQGNFKGKTLDEVDEYLRSVKTKTIKF